ncbi:MAG: glucose 1-dehydrogenase [Deltaproteobacteria bacterium]|nr:glucose 1-dehydrogenase [Deltaproteobacteria bacterium]MBM4323903.1 glucose 1-dehydrogenase [Deltaproteobacteria bacterium]MBM4347992.1 glucose 1-dehydrogenase [Deltaproteobacteria bacterium]
MKTMDLFDLKGKTAIVTGGGIGLGQQMALGLAEAGADIVICSRKLEKCQEMARQIESLGRKALALRCDLNREEEIDQVVKEILKAFGKVDILVNNAGRTWGGPVEELKVADWKKVIDLNITGTFQFTQRIGREMIQQRSGKIINIVSYAGLIGTDPEYLNAIAYNTSKGGLIAFTKDLAVKWSVYGIQVNAISPGWFLTEMTKWSTEHHGKKMVDRLLVKRFGGEDDLKGAVVFLASRASDYVTGHVLSVDGGLTAW